MTFHILTFPLDPPDMILHGDFESLSAIAKAVTYMLIWDRLVMHNSLVLNVIRTVTICTGVIIASHHHPR